MGVIAPELLNSWQSPAAKATMMEQTLVCRACCCEPSGATQHALASSEAHADPPALEPAQGTPWSALCHDILLCIQANQTALLCKELLRADIMIATRHRGASSTSHMRSNPLRAPMNACGWQPVSKPSSCMSAAAIAHVNCCQRSPTHQQAWKGATLRRCPSRLLTPIDAT